MRLDRGDRIRAFHIARVFAEAGYDVEVCAFETGRSAPARGVRESGASRVDVVTRSGAAAAMAALPALASNTPLQVAYYRSRKMRRLIAGAAARRPDVVIAHLFRMAPFALEVKGAYRVLDLCDSVAGEMARSLPHRRGLSRLVYEIETPRVRRYEVEIAKCFDEVWTVAPRDREELVERGAPPGVRVVPNGVDPTWFETPRRGMKRDGLVLFVGHLGVPHNADAVRFFASEVVPLIRTELPHAQFVAAGTGAGRSLRSLERRGLVRLPGFVPDLRRTLEEATVFVAPLRFAAGVQNKMLEAMAVGCPVVATPIVNAGVGAQPGSEIVLAAEPASLAAETIALLKDRDRAERLGEGGRLLVETRFTWNPMRSRAEQLRRRPVGGKSP